MLLLASSTNQGGDSGGEGEGAGAASVLRMVSEPPLPLLDTTPNPIHAIFHAHLQPLLYHQPSPPPSFTLPPYPPASTLLPPIYPRPSTPAHLPPTGAPQVRILRLVKLFKILRVLKLQNRVSDLGDRCRLLL